MTEVTDNETAFATDGGGEVRLSVEAGKVTSLVVRGIPGYDSITASALRTVPLGAMSTMARRRLGSRVAAWQALGVEPDDELARLVEAEAERTPPPGRRGHPDAVYARLAAEYATLVVAHGITMAELADRHHVSLAGLRSRLNIARRRGYLTEAPAGEAGGQLTDLARRVLDEETGDDDGKRR